MMKVEYGRYIIEVFSYRSGGKWRPDIRIYRAVQATRFIRNSFWRRKTCCSTQRQSPTRTVCNSPREKSTTAADWRGTGALRKRNRGG
jgi:hypothetical protein